ncbi:MAG: ribosome maturation factor RimM [Candidatus Competibacterales bacterium]
MTAATAGATRWLVLGYIAGVFGVRGWVKLFSYTDPRDQIVTYTPLYLRRQRQPWQLVELLEGRAHGKGVVAKFARCDDRDAAARLIGCQLGIPREQLPPPEPGEYYWADLEGLAVVTREGAALGVVSHLLATGAHDILVVKGATEHAAEHLIPFVQGHYIDEVDLTQGVIRVDWDPEF